MSTRAAVRTKSRIQHKGETARERIRAWLPPAVYALVCVVLFRETLLTGATLLGVDSMALSYFARSFYTQFLHAGSFPVWNPLIFGGIPFIDGMHGDILYPPSLALAWMDAATMWGWKMALHIFLAGTFAYIWLRGIGLRRGPAFFGGLVYMLGAQHVSLTFPGGDGKLFVSALAPLVFWLAERAVRYGRIGDFAFFALGIAAIVLTSHMQLAYFCVWGVSLYFLFRVGQRWRENRQAATSARLVGMFALAGLLGVGTAAIQFFPPLDYLREWSHRTGATVEAEATDAYAYSTSWSLHPEEIVSLAVAEFVGENVTGGNTYWGRNPFKLNHEYAGFIPLVLLPLLFLRRRDPRAWFFAVLGILSLLYALGATTPVFRLFYLIPGVSLFRAPSLIIFLYGLSVATLGAMALERLLDWLAGSTTNDADARLARRTLWILAGAAGVFAILASTGVLTSIWQNVVYPGLAGTPNKVAALEQNLPNIRIGFWITAGLAAAVAATVELAARRVVGLQIVFIAIVVLAGLDLYRVSRPFVAATVEMNRGADPVLFRPDDTIAFLQARRDAGEVFRVFDLGTYLESGPAYPQNILATHGIEQLTGHHGNEIGRYRTLVGGDAALNALESDLRLLDLLNVGYVTATQRLDIPGYQEVHAGSRSVVYRNLNALPRAYVVGSYEVVQPESMVERLLAPEFDRAGTVLLEEQPAGATPQAGVSGDVTWVERSADAYTLRVTTTGPALLVVSDNYYPAWRAEVDGTAAEILRANYAFRAVAIPGAGEHTVRFHYDAGYLTAPALASAGLLLLLTAVGVAGEIGKRRSVRGSRESHGGGREGEA
ncbi:MAG TPA: hypothetical protein VNZ57_10120 [Longimicrobiales bacterium]|nr:hypothetical protein [Longimicrobiales bacterium]